MTNAAGVRLIWITRLAEAFAAGLIIMALPLSVHEVSPGAHFSSMSEEARVGLLMSAFGLMLAAGQWISGAATRRGGSRRVLALAGLTTFAITSAFLPLATTYSGLLSVRLIHGFALGLVVPTTVSLIAGHAGAGRRGVAIGTCASLKSLGFAVGPIAAGILLNYVPLAFVYWAVAGIALLACWPLYRTPSAPPAEVEVNLESESPSSRWVLPGLAVGAFVASSCATQLVVLQGVFLSRVGVVGFGIAVAAMLLTRMLLHGPVGWLTDRYSKKPLLIAGLLLLSVGSVALGEAGSPLELVASRILMGVGMALFATPALAIATARHEKMNVTYVTVGFALGVAIGPLLTGFSLAIDPAAPFVLWATAATVAGLALLGSRCDDSIRESRQKPRPMSHGVRS